MHISSLALAASLLSATTVQPASAADAVPATGAPAASPQTSGKKADTSFSVGDIVVTADRSAGRSDTILTSVDRLGGDIAQRADVSNAFELVAQMPGIQLTNFNQGTTSGKFSLRGFNGEGNINAVKLLIDGVPSNSNDGNMPYIDMIFPLNIAGIEVVRGTSDPRYGLHAIAGSANITTRSGGTYLDARAAIGSYNMLEGQLVTGLEQGNLTQNYQLAYRRSDGYRDHSKTNRLSLSGRWGLNLGDRVRIGVIARAYDADAQEPGYLTFADSRADPRMTNAYNASDGDTRNLQQYAVTADVALSNSLDWASLAYYNRFRDDRFVKYSAGASQQRRLTEEDQQGLSSALHWRGDMAGMPLALEAGGNAEWQDNHSARWLSVERVPTSQTRDQQFDLAVGGVYAQAMLEPLSWLRITPAYRIDWVGGQFDDRLSNSAAPINDYGSIDQPKISVAILPTDGVTLYGNWGKTFQIGLGSGAYLIPPRQVDLAPSINTGWELGVKYQSGDLLEGRLAYWEQSATGEISRKLNDPRGDYENVGATDRRGVDLQLGLNPVAGLSVWGAVAWQEAVIAVPPAATPQLAGNRLNHVPNWLWSGGIAYRPVQSLSFSLTGRGQSSYYLTTSNAEGQWGELAVFDASATVEVVRRLELGLTVRNLADSFFEYVWWDGAQTLHSPANGRNVTASARLRF